MLWLLYCLPLLFKVWQRSGSCCCYIVCHYCLRFDRGVVHVIVILSTITVLGLTEEWFMLLLLNCLPLLFKILQRSGSCCCWYIVYINVEGFTEEWFKLWLITLSTISVLRFYTEVVPIHYWWRFVRGVVHFVFFIVYHFCLWFERGVVQVVLVILSKITF